MAGAPCPVEVTRAVIRDMNMADVTIAYGMTETSPVSFQTRISDPVDVRVSTVGRIMPHLEVKIVDDADRVTPLGQPGQLCTRGYSVMLGYWGEEAKTREVLDAAGWMHTGDLAVLDEQGYCRIIGRSKDIVIRGGENISPREIEEFLYRNPSVRDVQVVGVPDERGWRGTLVPGSSFSRGPPSAQTTFARSVAVRSPISRFPATSSSSIPSPRRRLARSRSSSSKQP